MLMMVMIMMMRRRRRRRRRMTILRNCLFYQTSQTFLDLQIVVEEIKVVLIKKR
jgi:hypothetical protein